MSPTNRIPPLDGSLRILPGFLDFHAEHNPSRHAFAFPSRENPEVLTYISCLELAQATHRVAHNVRPGRKGNDREVVALLVNTDALIYAALFNGIARAGLVVRIPSNTPQ